MNIKTISFAMLCLMLSACSTMNSDFSCNVTAGDSCLTIEQVDAMTHFADDRAPSNTKDMMKAENSLPFNNGAIATLKNGQSIWVSNKLKEHQWV